MTVLLERIARARDARHEAEAAFRAALIRAHQSKRYSWAELAAVAGLSRHGVRWLVLGLKHKPKEKP